MSAQSKWAPCLMGAIAGVPAALIFGFYAPVFAGGMMAGLIYASWIIGSGKFPASKEADPPTYYTWDGHSFVPLDKPEGSQGRGRSS